MHHLPGSGGVYHEIERQDQARWSGVLAKLSPDALGSSTGKTGSQGGLSGGRSIEMQFKILVGYMIIE